MALLVPDVGEQEMLGRILNKNTPYDVKLHLYTNNKTPAEGDTAGDYSESSGTGYGAITLANADWSITTTTGTTTAEHSQVTFTYTGAEPEIYGYYVTDGNAGTLLWAERFSDGPYAIPSGGGSVKITPKIELE
jgi:hypothetical protein